MLSQSLVKEFQAILNPENVMTDEADRITYACDATVLSPVMPAAVLRPTTSEGLAHTIRLCNENSLPLTIRGAGTNLSGGAVSESRGVVVVTHGLNRIIEINTVDMYAVVQPGVITAELSAAAEEKGLFYPPDPGTRTVSTLGGNVAENAGGLRGLKYGLTADYVMALTFFDPSGRVVKTGARTVKCATGYNIAGLLAGSEGTLGVFDEITLKLIPQPQHQQAMMAMFTDLKPAAETVAKIIADRIVPATLEFMDHFTIQAIEAFSHAGFPMDMAALLLIELDGHPAQVSEDALKVKKICRESGAAVIRVAKDASERDKVWSARRSALAALAKLKPTVILEDAIVPRSKVPDMVAAIQAVSRKHELPIGTFGHAGDGHLHPTILTDRRDTAEWARAEASVAAIFDQALALGGTLSGKHGTSIAKDRFLEKETRRATILYSKKIKNALDPNHILNPDKIIKKQRMPGRQTAFGRHALESQPVD